MKSITIVLFALLLLNVQTMACKCSGPSNIENSFKNAKVVFTGKVVEISYVPIEETFNSDSLSSIKQKVSESKLSLPVKKIVLEVKSVFKNSNISPNTRITIYTPPRSASCGFAFEVNKSYHNLWIIK
ncbi:hypothetical protein [Flammeovirga sp. OC4]|uniref:hypothetical protein n=1 Tax=Flammeovirga sp. OC4 TaxID=1382345 RepID=UPI0012E098A3|nr:hypothetical protein [Flammeovirga sp. OC4]